LLIHAGFLLGLPFNCEDGDHMFPRNTCWLSAEYEALHADANEMYNISSFSVPVHSLSAQEMAVCPTTPEVNKYNLTQLNSWNVLEFLPLQPTNSILKKKLHSK
jgi:hypothetical protein